MSRHVALPLLASGIALLTLAATVIPFEADAIGLAGRPAWERFVAFQPVVIATVLLAASAGYACWQAPRKSVTPILVALALGALSGTATLVTLPQMLGPVPARLVLTAH